MNVKKRLRKFYYRYYALRNSIIEKTSKKGVKYIFVNNKSDGLVVSFSAIGGDYNYRRSFKGSSWDQLYIKDSWAKGLSYYLYEDGQNYPEELTSGFITDFLSHHNYSKVVSWGSSKGGSAALYYGIKHKFDAVYCEACQYRVGDYVAVFHKDDNYYPKIMGEVPEEEGIKILNDKFANLLDKNANSQTRVKLVYSTKEHTYQDDIIHLIKKLNECNIMHEDQIETFPEHGMIGKYMTELCKQVFI